MTKTGGPAFPNPALADENYAPQSDETGLTLRDYFAGQVLSNPAICKLDDEYPQKTAYAFADAMIAERERTND